MRSLFVLLFLTQSALSAKFIDQSRLLAGTPFHKAISNSAVEVLHGSQRTNLVRQCTCSEMGECYEMGKQDALDCFEPCWNKLDREGIRVADDSPALKSCFDQRRRFIDDLVNCFKVRFRACAPTIEKAQKVQVHQYDYKEMVNKVEDVVEAQIKKFTQTVTSKAVKQLIDAAAMLGKCVKQCFLDKYKTGFCFDKKQCEPNISDRNARGAIHQCAKQINWKSEVSELCKCSSNAGVSGLNDYCGMLNVMG